MVDYLECWGEARVTKAERFIAPREISHAAYLRLFGPAYGEIPRLALAEADFFSDRPNDQNPIWKAYRRALQHVLSGNRHFELPYWWAYAVNHEFMAEPGFSQWRTHLNGQMRSGPTVDSSVGSTSENSDNRSLESDSKDAILKDCDSMVDLACAVVRDQFELGRFTANTGGCVFQGFGGRSHIVVPRFWQLVCAHVAQVGLTPEILESSFMKSGLLQSENDGPRVLSFTIVKFQSKKRLGKCRVIPLSGKGERMLFPDGVPFADNVDLVACSSRK
jgi:hypothetical protein